MTAPETGDLILDAAEDLFARQGFAGTTIKQIAEAAGVNSALLYYYYSDKEALYHAVLRRCMQRLAGTVAPAVMAATTPEEAIRTFGRVYTEALLDNPTLPRLMLRELLDHEAAHALPELRQAMGGFILHFMDLIRQAQQRGEFRSDVDPVNVVVSTLGQIVYAFMAQPLIQGVLLQRGTTVLDADWLRAFGNHAAEFSLAALRHPIPISTRA